MKKDFVIKYFVFKIKFSLTIMTDRPDVKQYY